LAKNVQGNPGLVKQINGIYKFNIDGKIWIVDLKNAPGSVKEGTAADTSDCTIMMKENDFVDMMSGTLDGQSAFMQGKLKLTGNMALAMKLSQLRSNAPKAKL
jgi:putative sterol carrier protein